MATPSQTHAEAGHAVSGKASYDDVNAPVIFMVGIISAIITFLIIAFVQGLCYHWESTFVRQRVYETGNRAVAEIIDKQKSELGVVAPDSGRISIEQAMEKTLAQFGSGTK